MINITIKLKNDELQNIANGLGYSPVEFVETEDGTQSEVPNTVTQEEHIETTLRRNIEATLTGALLRALERQQHLEREQATGEAATKAREMLSIDRIVTTE